MFSNALGNIFINDELAAKVREQLKESNMRQSSDEATEIERLQREQTKWEHRLDQMQYCLFDGTITKEEYMSKKKEAVAVIARTQADIDNLRRFNLRYKEQGVEIIDLIKGFKKIYEEADLDGKVRILDIVLDKVILKADLEESFFKWKPGFDLLFGAQSFINSKIKGML